MDSLVGTTLRGKYAIERVLGAGGMATVYLAVHRNGRKVAVKMLHPQVSANEDIKRRFLREGYLANKVEHSGAVAVLDDDVDEHGRVFVVMEYLEGESLGQKLERAHGPLSAQDVLPVAKSMLETLASAHARGIVHRDLKPDNIFLTTRNETKILDFGIARLHEADGGHAATQTGAVPGTPAFMSPEQAMGSTREIDARSDVWSVGATLFNLLTNEYVHRAETLTQYLIFSATQPARSILTVNPHVPAHLASVIDRALAFRKEDRWQNAEQMLAALDGNVPVGGETRMIPAPPPVVPQRTALLQTPVRAASTGDGFARTGPTVETKKGGSAALFVGLGLAGMLVLIGGGIFLATKDKTPAASSSASPTTGDSAKPLPVSAAGATEAVSSQNAIPLAPLPSPTTSASTTPLAASATSIGNAQAGAFPKHPPKAPKTDSSKTEPAQKTAQPTTQAGAADPFRP